MKLTFILFIGMMMINYVCLSADAIFDLVKLDKQSALCLDGSPGSYYISRDGDPNKVLIQFLGGAWCMGKDLSETLQNCYQRSKTYLGSSKNLSNIVIYKEGILSNNDLNNFKDWKKIILNYCDGSGHQGTKQKPVSYKNTSLYFRGHNITIQQFNSIQQKIGIFSKATCIVVGGRSAGASASVLWVNYVKDKVKIGKVWLKPDSGIFLDSMNFNSQKHQYRQGLANLVKIANQQIDPPAPECIKKYPNNKQNCLLVQNIFMQVKVPQFYVQSLYDSWSIPNILGIDCINDTSIQLSNCNQSQRQYIEQYHHNLSKILYQIGFHSGNGFWAPVCADHTFSWYASYYSSSYRIPQNSQYSISKAVQNWLGGQSSSNKHIDQGQWPSNLPCSGKKLKSGKKL